MNNSLIEIDKSDYHILKNLCPDDHIYVEIPMIVNDCRGRAWVDDITNPRLNLIALGDMAFIEGDGNIDLLKKPLEIIKEKTLEICCDRKYGDVVRGCFNYVSETFNVFFQHDGAGRNFSHPDDFAIEKLDSAIFHKLNETGEDWLGEMYLDGDDFSKSCGLGYAATYKNNIISASIAFSYDGRRVNIGVATKPEYRSLGLSTACTSALIKDLLARNIESVWITGPENAASRAVAEKNGFSETVRMPIYWTKTE